MEKETEKKGREAKKKGKICGFDAGISPWGMAGWLTPAGTGIRSAFSVFATFPKTPFPAIPRQQSRTNWEYGGIEAVERQESTWRMRSGWERRKWYKWIRKRERTVKRRVITEAEEGNNEGDKEVAAISSPYTPFNHAHTHTHTHAMYKHTMAQVARGVLE